MSLRIFNEEKVKQEIKRNKNKFFKILSLSTVSSTAEMAEYLKCKNDPHL